MHSASCCSRFLPRSRSWKFPSRMSDLRCCCAQKAAEPCICGASALATLNHCRTIRTRTVALQHIRFSFGLLRSSEPLELEAVDTPETVR